MKMGKDERLLARINARALLLLLFTWHRSLSYRHGTRGSTLFVALGVFWSEPLHTTQPLSSQRRSVYVFLKSFFPTSLLRADAAEIAAPCASVLA